MIREIFSELGLDGPGLIILYGRPYTGKTLTVVRLMEELAGRPRYYLYSEPLSGRYEERLRRAGVEVAREDSLPSAAARLMAWLTSSEGGVAAVDTVSAFAQHAAAEYLFTTGQMPKPLELVGPISFAANALAVRVADVAMRRQHLAIFIAQERPVIGQKPWYGEDGAPSFALRALHSAYAVARMMVMNDGSRVLRVVLHREPRYVGATAVVPPEEGEATAAKRKRRQ